MKISEVREIELLSALEPEGGYQLENLVCFSYNIAPIFAIATMVYCLPDAAAELSTMELSKFRKEALRRALGEIMPKCAFVVNGNNGVKCGNNISTEEWHILNRLCALSPRVSGKSKRRGSFHPKMIFASYEKLSDKKKKYAKLYVGSKNLTHDRAKEFGTVLRLSPKNRINSFSQSLLEFINKGVLRERNLKRSAARYSVQRAAILIDRYNFAPDKLTVKLHWQSRLSGKRKLWPIVSKVFKDAHEIFIASPWLSRGVCDELNVLKSDKCNKLHFWNLKSENKCLSNLHEELKDKLRVYYAAGGSIYSSESEDGKSESAIEPFHSKIITARKGRNKKLFFGSANFTNSGLGFEDKIHNTELMLEYDVRANQYCFERQLQSYEYEEEVDEDRVSLNEHIQDWIDSIEMEWKAFPHKIGVIYPEFTDHLKPSAKISNFDIGIYVCKNRINDIDDSRVEIPDNSVSQKIILSYRDIALGTIANMSTLETGNMLKGISHNDFTQRVSIRIKYQGNNIVSYQTLQLPERLVIGKKAMERIKEDFRLSQRECINALSEVIGEPIPFELDKPNSGKGGKTDVQRSMFTVDKFAYKMAQYMKAPDQYNFVDKMKRVRDILGNFKISVKKNARGEQGRLYKALCYVVDNLIENTNEKRR